tara:strand:- start:989 stop:2893 length:1905 start_codon:yes stop_codon:yes gene_type:complete
MRVFLCIFFLFFFGSVFSQECQPNKRKDKRLVKRIEKHIEKRDFYTSLDQLSKLSEYVIYGALKAEILWAMSDFVNAEKEGVLVIEFCPDNFPKVYYFLGEIAFNRKDYVSADRYLRKSIDLGVSDPYLSDAVQLYSKAKVLADIINNPVPFEPEVLKGISTKFDEYLPIISPNQDFSFFTRRSDQSSLHSITNTTSEEFVVSKKVKGGFSKGVPLPYPFNTESNEGGASITIDNRVLYYTRCTRNSENYNNCDIYYVNRVDGVWSEIQEFSGDISKADSWDSQPSVSSDGKTIIFASDRLGGYGKIDLYEINWLNGKWTAPKNLGPVINSRENEKSPFLHTDGQTLFFASTNFPSLGGFDIFYSRKDSLGNWQRPINIGFPINTSVDEISFFVSTDGETAYFASNQLEGIGGWDIYSFALYSGAKPERVLFLQGNLLDEYGDVVEDVDLEIKNIRTNEVTTINIESGVYVSSLVLSERDDVLLTVKKKGFSFHSTYISSDDSLFQSPMKLNIELESLENGKSFNLSNIYFQTNSYDINNVVREVLIEFANYLKINNNLVIEINGFTDDIGDESKNQTLSENRAKSVREIILLEGISPDRVLFNGYGEQFPIAKNTFKEGRAKNRRTEFKIIRQ